MGELYLGSGTTLLCNLVGVGRQIPTGPAFWWCTGAIALGVSSENCMVYSHSHGWAIANFVALRS